MPLQKKQSQSSFRRQKCQSQPQLVKSSCSPNTSRTSSSSTMHRPTFFLRRLRSKSVPTAIYFPNPSAEEAGLIISAAHRATARRRRPFSDSTSSPVSIYSSDDDDDEYSAITETISSLSAYEDKVVSTEAITSCHVSQPRASRPAPFDFSSPHPRSAVTRKESFASFTSSLISSDDGLTDCSDTETLSSLPTPTSLATPMIGHSQPSTPRRMVGNSNLKAYADGLFAFTQVCLSATGPASRPDLIASIPHIQFEDHVDDGMDLDEIASPQRPKLTSHFSDWSQVGTEADYEEDVLSGWGSVAQTPNWPLCRTPPVQAASTPDSYFSEMTPRASSKDSRWTETATCSPTHTPQSRSGTTASSSAIRETTSYFANFDSFTAAAEEQPYGLPLDFSLPEVSRTTPFTPGGMLRRDMQNPSKLSVMSF